MPVLEAGGVTRVGSSPTVRTTLTSLENPVPELSPAQAIGRLKAGPIGRRIYQLEAYRDALALHEAALRVNGSASFADIYEACEELDKRYEQEQSPPVPLQST